LKNKGPNEKNLIMTKSRKYKSVTLIFE